VTATGLRHLLLALVFASMPWTASQARAAWTVDDVEITATISNSVLPGSGNTLSYGGNTVSNFSSFSGSTAGMNSPTKATHSRKFQRRYMKGDPVNDPLLNVTVSGTNNASASAGADPPGVARASSFSHGYCPTFAGFGQAAAATWIAPAPPGGAGNIGAGTGGFTTTGMLAASGPVVVSIRTQSSASSGGANSLASATGSASAVYSNPGP
jgi:hypothetical protein